MIVRQWTGVIRRDRLNEYMTLLEQRGMREYAETPGFVAAYAFQRPAGENFEINLVSFWDSVDSLKAYAGADYEAAHYFPEHREIMIDPPPTSPKYDVVLSVIKDGPTVTQPVALKSYAL